MKGPFLCLTCAIGLTVACGGSDTARSGSSDEPARTTVQEARDRETTTRSGADAEHTDAEVRTFVMSMATEGAAEVQLGRLASERGADQEVKRFGADMARDHASAGEELKQLAGQLDISIPSQLDEEHRGLADRLSRLTGKAFDTAYMAAMVDAHQQALTSLQAHAGGRASMTGGGGQRESGQPAATSGAADRAQQIVSEWAAKHAPVVQAHLQRAREVQARISGSSSAPAHK